MDFPVKFGDSTSNRSRDIEAAQFVMNDKRTPMTPAYAAHHIRPKRHTGDYVKKYLMLHHPEYDQIKQKQQIWH